MARNVPYTLLNIFLIGGALGSGFLLPVLLGASFSEIDIARALLVGGGSTLLFLLMGAVISLVGDAPFGGVILTFFCGSGLFLSTVFLMLFVLSIHVEADVLSRIVEMSHVLLMILTALGIFSTFVRQVVPPDMLLYVDGRMRKAGDIFYLWPLWNYETGSVEQSLGITFDDPTMSTLDGIFTVRVEAKVTVDTAVPRAELPTDFNPKLFHREIEEWVRTNAVTHANQRQVVDLIRDGGPDAIETRVQNIPIRLEAGLQYIFART